MTQDCLKPDMEVLELGCGTGTTALNHAPFVKNIQAIDISEGMLEIARSKAEAGNVGNVSFEKSSIGDFEADDATYDAVMAHSILHLLDDKRPTLEKIHRMLKPGGVFVSSTVCLDGMMRLLKPVLLLGRMFGLLPLVRFFTAEELKNDLTDAGFRIDHQWQPEKGKAVFIVATKA